MKNTFKILLKISGIISKIGLIILAFYCFYEQNYLAAICIWIQLIYIKLSTLKKSKKCQKYTSQEK